MWSSPVQPAPLVNLVAYPQLQLVVTVDTQGLIRGWNTDTGSEWAFFSLPTSCSSMEACDHPEGSFLLVSDTHMRTHTHPFSGAPRGLSVSWGSHCGGWSPIPSS